MKESMEDRIIERYLNGQMRPEEEREFRALLEIDADLRRRMDAERIVQQALEHDRAEIRHEESGSYARFLAALATSVPAAEGALLQSAGGSSASTTTAGSTVAGAAAGSSAGLSSGMFATMMASGMAKGLIGVVAAVTMATGLYVATPSAEEPARSDSAAVSVPAATPEKNSPMMIDSSAPAAGQLRPEAEPVPAPASQETNAVDDRQEPVGTTIIARPEASSADKATRNGRPQEAAGTESQKEDDLDAMLKSMERDAAREIDVIETDSAKTAVKIGTKKGSKE